MTRKIPETDGNQDTLYEDLEVHERTGFYSNEKLSDETNTGSVSDIDESADRLRHKKD
ncbi:hypothetical protein [Paenibacillus sp. R14(2021)]|uniref:hypothetical protein n=1 Tax=Paenibacillus sp. R14(2021) TaxID=2859228 RepID=UPI001C612A73|nr:hypothetical protein [Paenibacillus sp. R14(2021)]